MQLESAILWQSQSVFQLGKNRPTTTASFPLPGLIHFQIPLCADESCLLVDLDGAFLGKLHVKLSKLSEID